MATSFLLLDFSPATTSNTWRIVNDGVMGGLSSSQFSIDPDGHGVFEGEVSLENNGGFAMVQFPLETTDVRPYSTLRIRLKGDGKRYQFRLRAERGQRFTYVQDVETTGDWEVIELPLADFYPAWRGRQLDMPNFPGEQLVEMAILIGNKRAENFALRVDWIGMQ